MTYYEEKKRLKKAILTSLSSVPEVLSVTIVGSFVDSDDLTGISDIDTIVICDRLTQEVFEKCLDKAKAISLESIGLKEYRLKINTSFGPLKFDEPQLAVLHLMIYDIDGHCHHAVASPFTCLDWERSCTFEGEKLKEVFPVGRLQPRDFQEARRGLDNYLNDLQNGTISIRDYVFQNTDVAEVVRTHPLDDRHRGEYAYHIVRNLILNKLKLLNAENRLFTQSELENEIEELLDRESSEHKLNFRHLTQLKKQRSKVYPEWTLDWTKAFIRDFQKDFVHRWENAQTVHFIRHARTSKNDGTFLGQGRNPSILTQDLVPFSGNEITKLYCSPAKRCMETAELMVPNLQIVTDERLREINYGAAEGFTFEQLKEYYPEMIHDWAAGQDPHFPSGGENTNDVLVRILDFINELKSDSNQIIAVMTHNVVLRCLIGEAHDIPKELWYRLLIPHAECLEFKLLDGKLYANIDRNQLGEVFSKLRKS